MAIGGLHKTIWRVSVY